MGLRRFIARNFWAKFLSFVLAFMTWLSIRTGRTNQARAETEGKIPVAEEPVTAIPTPAEALNPKPKPDADALATSEPFLREIAVFKPASDAFAYEVKPDEVEVVVKGKKESLGEMETKEIRVFVDITDVLEKFNTAEHHTGIPVRVNVHTPSSVALASVEPTLATVKRVPPPEPKEKPKPEAPESIKPDQNPATNNVGRIQTATNAVQTATNAPAADGASVDAVDKTEAPSNNE